MTSPCYRVTPHMQAQKLLLNTCRRKVSPSRTYNQRTEDQCDDVQHSFYTSATTQTGQLLENLIDFRYLQSPTKVDLAMEPPAPQFNVRGVFNVAFVRDNFNIELGSGDTRCSNSFASDCRVMDQLCYLRHEDSSLKVWALIALIISDMKMVFLISSFSRALKLKFFGAIVEAVLLTCMEVNVGQWMPYCRNRLTVRAPARYRSC